MQKFLQAFHLPLLVKELTEKAARPRTYVIRVTYALLFFIAALVLLWEIAFSNPGLNTLGRGDEIFQMLVAIQCVGIIIFLPAITSGAITFEKERQSLPLLFLTDLSPWQIILQKYLGGIIATGSFLLLSLPIFGIAYALGGIEVEAIFSGIYVLLLTCFQVAAITLMCSALCRTTVSAFLLTYFLGAAYYFGFFFLSGFEDEGLLFFPIYLFFDHDRIPSLIAHSIPALVTTGLFLIFSRIFLVKRAFAPPSNPVLALFGKIDRGMNLANARLGRNITIIKDSENLPLDKPVRWRELTHKTLGKARYLIRIFLPIEILVLGISLLCLTESRSYRNSFEFFYLTEMIMWVIMALVVSVQGANLMVAERVNQTMDVLLTTPLSGREIVQQKVAGLYRFCAIAVIPFLTILAAKSLHMSTSSRNRGDVFETVYGSVLTLGATLPFVCWLSVFIGLRIRSRFKAVVTSIITLMAWSFLPIVALFIADEVMHFSINDLPASLLFFTSPATGVALSVLAEWDSFDRGLESFYIIFNTVLYLGLALFFRHLCLKNADRYLGRAL